MASGVYVIENTVNGRRYVGSAINIRKRWNEHRRHGKFGVDKSVISTINTGSAYRWVK